MKTYSIHIDKNNFFNQIFVPLSHKFLSVLKLNGAKVIFDQEPSNKVRKIIFGSHAAPEYWLSKINNDDIIVNLEPIFKTEFRKTNKTYLNLLNNAQVLDYSSKNLNFLNNAKLFNIPPFYVTPQSGDKITYQKTYDILFVGSVNKLRDNYLKILNNKYKLVTGFKIFSNNLDTAIKSSKLYLHIKQDEFDLFNYFKFSHCMLYPTVYAGHSGILSDDKEFLSLKGLTIFSKDEDLFNGIDILLNDEEMYFSILKKQKIISESYNKQFEILIKELIKN